MSAIQRNQMRKIEKVMRWNERIVEQAIQHDEIQNCPMGYKFETARYSKQYISNP